MLKIKDAPDLLRYLEARLAFAERQKVGTKGSITHREGMIYAYYESIRAVKALIEEQQTESEKQEKLKIAATFERE